MKFWCAMLLVLMLISATVFPVFAANDGAVDEWDDYPRGDVNCDNSVNARDYLMLKRAVLQRYTLKGDEIINADVNLDGRVDARDYLVLKRVVLGSYSF